MKIIKNVVLALAVFFGVVMLSSNNTLAAEIASDDYAVACGDETYIDGFDPFYYAQENPDVYAAFGYNEALLYQHYIMFGKAEGRKPNAGNTYSTAVYPTNNYAYGFDPAYYAATYPDVYAAFGNNPDLLYQHYINCGIYEGRKPNANGASYSNNNATSTSYYNNTNSNTSYTNNSNATATETTQTYATDNSSQSSKRSFILNANSKKAHRADCGSGKKTSSENRIDFYGTVQEVKDMGYSPCGNCHPF